MIKSLEDFYNGSVTHVSAFDSWVSLHAPEATADHICYKCESSTEFEAMRAIFEPTADYIYQSIISKRRISIIKLPRPITTALGEIHFLELSDQKPDDSQKSEFDHIEIYPKTGTSDDLATALESKGVSFEKVIRPHHTTFDTNIKDNFKVRLEDEPLITKIVREEIK